MASVLSRPSDGRVPHSVLLELLTPHGVGTRISRAGA